jgi:DNA-binding NtrC family response regulator
MMKRFVILQDENLLLAELKRPRTPDGTAMAAPLVSGNLPVTMPPMPAIPQAAMTTPYVNGSAAEPAPMDGAAGSDPAKAARLPDVARAAALTAEREAITSALDKYRWNRRKAARLLGVSYKTLLNKMKACGITAPPGSAAVE